MVAMVTWIGAPNATFACRIRLATLDVSTDSRETLSMCNKAKGRSALTAHQLDHLADISVRMLPTFLLAFVIV